MSEKIEIGSDGKYRVEYDDDGNIISEEPIGIEDRLDDIERSVGKGGGGQRGIAHRIDNLEDEIEAIKDEIGMS